MTIQAETRKALKCKIATEIRSYLTRITETSKWATFEVADWEPMLEDVLKTVEEVMCNAAEIRL